MFTVTMTSLGLRTTDAKTDSLDHSQGIKGSTDEKRKLCEFIDQVQGDHGEGN